MPITQLRFLKNFLFVAFLVMVILAVVTALNGGREQTVLIISVALTFVFGYVLISFKVNLKEAIKTKK